MDNLFEQLLTKDKRTQKMDTLGALATCKR